MVSDYVLYDYCVSLKYGTNCVQEGLLGPGAMRLLRMTAQGWLTCCEGTEERG